MNNLCIYACSTAYAIIACLQDRDHFKMRSAVSRATVGGFGRPLLDLIAESMVGWPGAPDFELLLRLRNFNIFLDERDIKSCHAQAGQLHVCQTALFRLAQMGILDPPVALITLGVLEVAAAEQLPCAREFKHKETWVKATLEGHMDSLHGAAASRFTIVGGCLQANSHDRHLHNQESHKEPEDGEVADYESKSDWHTKGTRNSDYSYKRPLPDLTIGPIKLDAETQRHLTIYDKAQAGNYPEMCGHMPRNYFYVKQYADIIDSTTAPLLGHRFSAQQLDATDSNGVPAHIMQLFDALVTCPAKVQPDTSMMRRENALRADILEQIAALTSGFDVARCATAAQRKGVGLMQPGTTTIPGSAPISDMYMHGFFSRNASAFYAKAGGLQGPLAPPPDLSIRCNVPAPYVLEAPAAGFLLITGPVESVLKDRGLPGTEQLLLRCADMARAQPHIMQASANLAAGVSVPRTPSPAPAAQRTTCRRWAV